MTMNNPNPNQIIKRLGDGASLLAEDNSSLFTRPELEAALSLLVEKRRRDGESAPKALVRAMDDKDEAVAKVLTALEVSDVDRCTRTVSPEHQIVKSRLHKNAEHLMEEHVEKNRKPDETTAQAYSRLARDRDPSFTELYEHLTEIHRDL